MHTPHIPKGITCAKGGLLLLFPPLRNAKAHLAVERIGADRDPGVVRTLPQVKRIERQGQCQAAARQYGSCRWHGLQPSSEEPLDLHIDVKLESLHAFVDNLDLRVADGVAASYH